MIILGTVRPLSRHLVEAHPQVSIIARRPIPGSTNLLMETAGNNVNEIASSGRLHPYPDSPVDRLSFWPMGDAVDSVRLVAFVESPLQALNLVEYSSRFSRRVDVVVVGDSSESAPTNRMQIEAVLSHVSPRRIICHESRLWARRPRRSRRAVATGVCALRVHLPAEPHEFVVGEFRSAFSWAVLRRLKVRASSVVVLDDGTAMLRIDRRQSVPRSREQRRQKIKSLMLLAYGIRGSTPRAGLTFFTAYALEDRVAVGDAVVRNDYRTLSAELRNLPVDEDFVYVIGSPLREAGVVDGGDLELAFELARFATDWTGKKVVYVAHRRESAEKLDALREEVSVVTPNMPFEVYPRALGKRPRTIIGYYSSLFLTVPKFWGGSVEIIALEIPRGSVNASSLSFVENVYRYYRTELGSGVRVVEPQTPPA